MRELTSSMNLHPMPKSAFFRRFLLFGNFNNSSLRKHYEFLHLISPLTDGRQQKNNQTSHHPLGVIISVCFALSNLSLTKDSFHIF